MGEWDPRKKRRICELTEMVESKFRDIIDYHLGEWRANFLETGITENLCLPLWELAPIRHDIKRTRR